MDNRGTRRPGGKKSGKKATQRRAPAGLGFKGMQSFLKNQEAIESFMNDLEAGAEDLSRYSVGRVESGVGASHFRVTLIPSGEEIPSAGIPGYLKGGSPAAGTFIGRDSMVLVYDSRTHPMNRGRTHTILAVLGAYQAETILGMLGVAPAEEDDLFDREVEAAATRAEVARTQANLAAMRRTTRKASSSSSGSGSGSGAMSRKSSSSVNFEEEFARNKKDKEAEKKKRQFHARKARKAAAKAAAATGAGGEGAKLTA
jgi:hypothetical protein